MHRTANRPARRTAGTALDSERGAFDLPSIVTGVVVVGVLTAGVLASVFGVIPFAQDNGAKQDLAAVNTAQAAARVKEGRFLDSAGLRNQGYLSASARSGAADSGGFVRVTATDDTTVMTDEAGTCYVALSRSGTGEIFVTSDTKRDPQLLTPLTQAACVIPSVLQSAAGAVGGFKDTYIPGVPTGLATQSVTSSKATFSWNAAEDATGYRVEYRVNAGAWTVLADNQAATTAVVPAPGNTTVELRVAARNAAGASAASQSVSVVLPAANTYTWASAAAPITGYAGMVTNADGTLRLRASGDKLYLSKDGGATWPQTGASVYMSSGYNWYNLQVLCNGAMMTAWEGYSGGANDEWGSRNAGSTWQDYGVGSACSIPQVKSTDGQAGRSRLPKPATTTPAGTTPTTRSLASPAPPAPRRRPSQTATRATASGSAVSWSAKTDSTPPTRPRATRSCAPRTAASPGRRRTPAAARRSWRWHRMRSASPPSGADSSTPPSTPERPGSSRRTPEPA